MTRVTRALGFVIMSATVGSAIAAEAPPDLTRRNTVDRTLTYNLGATGLRGWI